MCTRILCSYLWHCEYFALVILLLTILRKLWPQPRLTIFFYLQKKTKIVYLLRNPKDVAVSLYNHVRDWTVLGYQGSWPDFLQLFLYTGGRQQYIIISTQPIIIYHHNRNLIDHWVRQASFLGWWPGVWCVSGRYVLGWGWGAVFVCVCVFWG